MLFFLWPVVASRKDDPAHAFEFVILIVLSVLLHELGHALAAKRYNLKGLSIMLHGFGGFATSSGERNWKQSLVITLAGPAVTFILGIVCLIVGRVEFEGAASGTEAFEQWWLIYSLGVLNIWMGFLNVIPSLPFDGGNGAQAILSRNMTDSKATRAVGHLGLVVSPLLIIYWALTGNAFVGIFGLMGTVSSVQTLLNSGGIKFGEVFADRKDAQEMAAQRMREVERKEAYLTDVRTREKERGEKERLRRMFEVVDGDEK